MKNRKHNQLSHFFLKWAVILIVLNAILQLAISQIHITAIQQMFVTDVGVYLFAFIIFGLVSLFNATRTKTFSGKLGTIFFSLFTTFMGMIYIIKALGDKKVQVSDIQTSLIILGSGMFIYLISAFMIVIGIVINFQNRKQTK